jgi:hypothetical protein
MSYLNYVQPLKKKKSVVKKSSIENDSLNTYIIDQSLKNRKNYKQYIELENPFQGDPTGTKEEISRKKEIENSQNITDISKKYMDFDSTYRNRNQYQNPCDYNVPVYSSNNAYFTSNYQNYIDLIDDATPISNSSKPASDNVTGYTADELHIQLDQAESDIPNYYINTTIEIDGDYRNVIYYDNITKIVTIDEPFVAIPPPGRPYTFRKFKNLYTANIIPIELNYIPGQSTPIVNKMSGDKSVSQLSILSSNFKITKELYLNSIMRFLNGPHKEKTSSIVSFDQIVPDEGWIQPYYGTTDINNQSSMELLSYYNSKGLSFNYSGVANYFYLFGLTTRVFSSQANRLILIEIIVGDLNIPDTIQYYRTTSLITVAPYTEQNVNIIFDTPVLLRPQRTIGSITYNADVVNIFFQDVTDGGNANGYINLITSNNSSIDVQLFGFNTVPYLELIGFTQESVYQLNSYGNNSFISTTSEQGLRIFNSVLSLPLYLTLDTDVFDNTTNRSLRIQIREGQNLNNTIIYNNTISLNNTSYSPTTFVVFTNYNISSNENNTTYWLYSTGSANLLNLPNQYNDQHYASSFVVPSDIGKNNYIIVAISGNTVTGLSENDITLYVNNTGSNTSLFTQSNPSSLTAGAFTIYFKIDNSLDTVFIPEQNLDFIFGISNNINTTTNPITLFDMTLYIYNSDSNQIELYKLDTPLNIDGTSTTFTNTNINASSWLYSGAFNYLPSGYNNLALPSSYTIPANYQSLACMTLTFNGFSDGILSANDFYLKINVSGTGNTLKTLYCPSINTINFSINFYITSNDNIPFVASQQLDFILCIVTRYNTFRYTQLNVDFRYIDNSYYTGSLAYLNPNSYYTITFEDLTGDNNNNGFINFNGYTEAPEETSQTSLLSANFNGFCPSLKIDGINKINNNFTTIWDNYNLTDFTQSQPIATGYEQYVYFISPLTGNLTNITLNLMVFNTTVIVPPVPLRNRRLEINFYDANPFNPVPILTVTIDIPYTLSVSNNSARYDYNIDFTATPAALILNNGYYFSVRDITGDSNSEGYIFIYGSDVNYNLTSNFDIFPRFLLNSSAGPSTITINNSTLNPFDIIPIANEVGFEFSFNQNIGVINPFLIALSSFSSLNLANPDYIDVPNPSQRTLRIRYRFGSGVAGSILYQRDYIVNNLLEPYITSIFLSDLSLDLLAGQAYTLTLEDVTPTGNTLGYTFFHGINAVAPYNSFNTTIYPLLYLSQVFYYVTISPPMPLSGFLNDGFDLISFNSLIRENSRPLNYRGLPYTEVKYYEMRLKHLIMPNKPLKVCYGGNLDNYPFFYIEIFNEGDRGTTSLMYSNNTNQNVIFKVYIDRIYYDQPTSFYVLKTYDDSEQRQIFVYRPDKDTRIRILMPDGQTIVQYQESDKLSPFYPNPLLQTNILLSLRPVNNFNSLKSNNFLEVE